MTRERPPIPDSREARLRAALRANLARRKEQARAREDRRNETPDPDPAESED